MTDAEIFTLIAQKEEERSLLRHKYAKEDLIIRDELTKLKNSLLNNESNYWYFDASALRFVEYEYKDMGDTCINTPVYGPVGEEYKGEGEYLWVTVHTPLFNAEDKDHESRLNELGLFKDRDDAIEDSIRRIKLFKAEADIECSPVIRKTIKQ